ncbi:MAG: ATP-binding protein [Opitutales bacterium]
MPWTVRSYQVLTLTITVCAGLILAGIFSWTAVQKERSTGIFSEDTLSYERLLEVGDRIDIFLTAADLSITSNETYSASWAVERAASLEASVQQLAKSHPKLSFSQSAAKYVADIQGITELMQLLLNRSEVGQTVLSKFDAIAADLVNNYTRDKERAAISLSLSESNLSRVAQRMTTLRILSVFAFLIISAAISLWALRKVISPIEILGTASWKRDKEAIDQLAERTAPREIQVLTRYLQNFVDELSKRVQARTKALEEQTQLLENEVIARKEAEAVLQKALEKEEKASQAKTTFMSVMSHELRTPMNTILGALHLLQDTKVEPRQTSLISLAEGASQNLLVLLNNILDLTKVESDGIELSLEAVEIEQYTKRIQEQTQIQCAATDCILKTELSEAVPPRLILDAAHLLQVLQNFINNACKFAPSTEITLRVIPSPKHANWIRFSVHDHGPGIPEHLQAKIFEPFKQVDASLGRSKGGIGMGLAICRQIAQGMDCTIGVNSNEGKGSEFYIEGCFEAFDGSNEVGDIDLNNLSNRVCKIENALKDIRPKVLLVEDNQVNQTIATLILEKYGFIVSAASDGPQACAISETTHFDLILMDLQLPGMDGFAATRQIRDKASMNCDTPVFALTANIGAESLAQIEAASMAGLIAKPIDTTDLLTQVANVLELPDSVN